MAKKLIDEGHCTIKGHKMMIKQVCRKLQNYADILLLISSSRLPPTPGTQLNVVEWEEVEVAHVVES